MARSNQPAYQIKLEMIRKSTAKWNSKPRHADCTYGPLNSRRLVLHKEWKPRRIPNGRKSVAPACIQVKMKVPRLSSRIKYALRLRSISQKLKLCTCDPNSVSSPETSAPSSTQNMYWSLYLFSEMTRFITKFSGVAGVLDFVETKNAATLLALPALRW
jgi:hypothetical protein